MVWQPKPMLETSSEPSLRRPVTVVAAVTDVVARRLLSA